MYRQRGMSGKCHRFEALADAGALSIGTAHAKPNQPYSTKIGVAAAWIRHLGTYLSNRAARLKYGKREYESYPTV